MAIRFEFRPARRIDDELLHELGERVVLAVPHHSVAFYAGRAWLAAAAVWTFLVLASNARVEALLPVFLIAGRGWWLLVRTHLDWFVVTDLRILRIQGVFNVKHAAMSLSRIVDFTMEQPFWGQFYRRKYGHLVFENAAQDQGLREIRYIGRVTTVYKLIQELAFEAGGGPARHKRSVPAEPALATAEGGGPWTGEEDTGEVPPIT